MRIPEPVVMFASGGVTTAVSLFWQQSVEVMLPWLITTFAVIIADLAAGIRKAHLLSVHISPSTAIRETMGKAVVYFGFVMSAAMIDVAAKGNMEIAKWCCLFIIVVEGGSVVSNILIPYGIRLSLKAIIKFFLKKSPLGVSDEDAEDFLKQVRKENEKWNKRKYTGDQNIDKRPKNPIYDTDGIGDPLLHEWTADGGCDASADGGCDGGCDGGGE